MSAVETGQPFRWLNASLLYAIHGEQLAEHGGAAGVRDENPFDLSFRGAAAGSIHL